MNVITNTPKVLAALAMLSVPAGGLSAQQLDQQQEQEDGEVLTTVYGTPPADLSELAEGPEIEGFISARQGNKVQVTTEDGTSTVVTLGESTEIKSHGGFLGLGRDELVADQLLSGLPVEVETRQFGQGLVASRIDLKDEDLETAMMIHNGTNQRFAEQGALIADNAAAADMLRGRMGDIDQYNVKRTTNVHFDTGKAALSPQAERDLCATAAEAEATENALMLVVGYTDSTGPQEFNQQLSEERAGRVVNYLQQACGWKPYRMLTPTGMAEADPLASNETVQGKAQNRRVAVNVLVSKSVDGLQ